VERLGIELELAMKVMAERKSISDRIAGYRIHELEKIVLSKSYGWQEARGLLEHKRLEDLKIKHVKPQLPISKNFPPFDPEGTEGDSWRNHGA